MPDITPEELRSRAKFYDAESMTWTSNLIREAADTIERQAARIAELEREVEGWKSDLASWKGDHDRIEASRDTALHRVAELERVVDALVNQVAALREKNRKMEVIVRERTHRIKGCLCERCLEQEFHEAEVIAALRTDAERYRWLVSNVEPAIPDTLGRCIIFIPPIMSKHADIHSAIDAARNEQEA